MRIILKIFAAPVVAALTLVVALSNFVLSLSGFLFSIVSFVIGVLAIYSIVTGDTTNGIICLVIAFLVSPFGLPAFAGRLVERLDDLSFALKEFIAG